MTFSAGTAVADLAAILAERSAVGVPEDCLVWIDGCNAGVRFVKAKPGHKRAESSGKKQ